MSETQLLRSSAIVRNATTGVTPPLGQVKTGELPLVQVKMVPGGPQVQNGQQKAVEILPPRDAQSAVTTGGLPMVQVKMTQNGPQPNDGRDNPVLIKNNRQTVTAGALPMVQVRMDNGRPQVQTVPNVQAGPPQIPAAAPALSHQRVATLPQATQALPHAPHVRNAPPQMQSTSVALGQPRVARVPAPSRAALPDVPELSTEQLMLCRHLVEKYLADLRTTADGTTVVLDDESDADSAADVATCAATTLVTIDDTLVAIAARAEAAAIAAATPVRAMNTYVAPRPVTGGHFSQAALSPGAGASPRNGGYVARTHVARARTQGNASMAPRRVQRAPGEAPLPPVIVQMNGNQPLVQPPAEAPVAAEPDAPDASANSDAQG